jgi:hypothetical protein
MSHDLRSELKRAAGPEVEKVWSAAEADFRTTTLAWDRPHPMALLRLIEATQTAFASATTWQALADDWSPPVRLSRRR